MAVPTVYLTRFGKLKPILGSIQQAAVPDRFTNEFLRQLGYTSSLDRPVINVLKALGFLSDSGEPTERYRRYKDTAQSKAVMAEAIRDAYADVFGIDEQANSKNASELKGMFARLSGKSDSVNEKMAGTFRALADMADFNAVPASAPGTDDEEDSDEDGGRDGPPPPGRDTGALVLRHDVHVHLPISTDIAVYDAIFRSLRENLG